MVGMGKGQPARYFTLLGGDGAGKGQEAASADAAVHGGSERIIRGWVKELDQEKFDSWMHGEISVKERVQELLDRYGRLAKSSKWALLRWVDGLTGEGIYRWLTEQRPDLRLGEPRETCAHIDADLREVRALIEAL